MRKDKEKMKVWKGEKWERIKREKMKIWKGEKRERKWEFKWNPWKEWKCNLGKNNEPKNWQNIIRGNFTFSPGGEWTDIG